MKKLLWIISFSVCLTPVFASPKMSQQKLEQTVKSFVKNASGEKGVVKFTYQHVKMFLISDVTHDRMRIIAPIVKYEKLGNKHIKAILSSNFHKALDARYAVSDGVLYSAYIHPLSPLNTKQIKSAVLQVANLALSFGREYSSGILSYGRQGKDRTKKNPKLHRKNKSIEGAI